MFKREFSMSELLRIALGARKLNRNNLDVLHTVLKYLLVKLNCQNEVVIVWGTCSYKLMDMLPSCQPPRHQFDQRKVVKPCEEFRKLDVLERRCDELNKRYMCHFRGGKTQYPNSQWEFYTMPFESICSSESPRNGKLRTCDIVESNMLINKLGILAGRPIIRRLKHLGEMIESSRQQLEAFEKRNASFTDALDIVRLLIHDLKILKITISDNHDVYEDTVDEINEMLTAKLDRLLFPAIKIFLRKQFDFVEQIVRKLNADKQQNTAQNIPMTLTATQCLCCGMDQGKVKRLLTIPSIMRGFDLVKCTHRFSEKDCMVRGRVFRTI